jgi:hypothetical protein
MQISAVIDNIASLTGLSHDWSAVLGGLLVGVLLGRVAKSGSRYSISARRASAGPIWKSEPIIQASESSNVTVSSKTVNFSPADTQEILKLLKAGNKIQAVKFVREKYGMDLATAKHVVDAVESKS